MKKRTSAPKKAKKAAVAAPKANPKVMEVENYALNKMLDIADRCIASEECLYEAITAVARAFSGSISEFREMPYYSALKEASDRLRIKDIAEFVVPFAPDETPFGHEKPIDTLSPRRESRPLDVEK
jgi:hypothetical protein